MRTFLMVVILGPIFLLAIAFFVGFIVGADIAERLAARRAAKEFARGTEPELDELARLYASRIEADRKAGAKDPVH